MCLHVLIELPGLLHAPVVQLRLENHQHYVQGVAWDPLGRYLCSQSNDRTCKVGRKEMAGNKNTG